MTDIKSPNCSLPLPTPNITVMFHGMTETQRIVFYTETFACAWLFLLLFYDFFYFKKMLTDHPRLQSVLFIQSTFVFYATTSMLSVISPTSSTLIDLVFTVYFSYTLKEILWVMMDYLGGDVCAASHLEDARVRLAVSPLCCLFGRCCPMVFVTRKYFYWIKFGVYQCAFLHTIFDFISAFLWSNGLYYEGYNDPRRFSFYLEILEKMSILLAMYSLTSLFMTTYRQLAPFHIGGKFLCIQITMIISGFQRTIFGLLVFFDVFQCTNILSATDRATVYHHYVVVPEMVLLYVVSRYFHTRDTGAAANAFSTDDTPPTKTMNDNDERTPLLLTSANAGIVM